MFQDFSAPPAPALGPARVGDLRVAMADMGLDAFIVPRADAHQGEYVAPAAERLKWLTGFTGSAGNAVVAMRKAVLLVDGRYTLQGRTQTDADTFEVHNITAMRMSDWIAAALAPKGTAKTGSGKRAKATGKGGPVVGFDPWLHTAQQIEQLTTALAPKGITVKPVTRNPIDKVWGRARPAEPTAPVIVHAIERAGKAASEKIAELKMVLKDAGEDAAILTRPDSIAWAFNIRGSDIAHTPTPLAFAILHVSDKPELFIAGAKLDKAARQHLSRVADLHEPDAIGARIDRLRQDKKRVRLHLASAAWWLQRRLGGAKADIADAVDPCQLPKAIKNAAEIAGCRAAHERDGVAMARYLAWLAREAPGGTLDEIGAVQALEQFRADTQALKEISFDTISGSGPNGAIVHYRVSEATNRRLRPGELFLVDSGGQYADGTTDITRTVAIGQPTREMCERFTLVLQAHIAVATARFPRGTTGAAIDAYARRPLWEKGFDYDHGTGHGVGSYLSVHEGPQSISRLSLQGLEPGMIVSNEPGYYKEGAYGIRLENLVLVHPASKIAGGERDMVSFETLTFCPFDRHLVVVAMLDTRERTWLDAYHADVARLIGPHLTGADKAWLDAATAPL